MPDKLSPKPRTLFIDDVLFKKVRALAFRQERSISDVVRELLTQALSKQGEKP